MKLQKLKQTKMLDFLYDLLHYSLADFHSYIHISFFYVLVIFHQYFFIITCK